MESPSKRLDYLDLYVKHIQGIHSQLGEFLKMAQSQDDDNKIRDIMGMLRGLELAMDALQITADIQKETQSLSKGQKFFQA
jgi:hypothetical protein